LQLLTQALADRRALLSAALTGSGLVMAITAAFMAGGLGRAADAERAERTVTSDQIASLLDYQTDGAQFDRVSVDHSPRLVVLDRGREMDCLTQAVYFEARGETAAGQQAVAQVVLNRVKAPGFPKSVCGVVYQGAANHDCQFSFACDGSTRRGREFAAWDRARKIAGRAMGGAVMAEVGSATHFHTTGVSPAWAGMTRVAQVGLHVFYRPGGRELIQPREAITEKAMLTGLSASAVVAVAPSMHMAATLAAEAKATEASKATGTEVSAVKTAETATY
jgi:spore germination cell wall hydrolase CwlJ-like protein